MYENVMQRLDVLIADMANKNIVVSISRADYYELYLLLGCKIEELVRSAMILGETFSRNHDGQASLKIRFSTNISAIDSSPAFRLNLSNRKKGTKNLTKITIFVG